MSTDAIAMLEDDHTRVKKLFREFQQTEQNAKQTRNRIVTRIPEELTVHTYLENEVIYPEVRRLVPDLEADILESYEAGLVPESAGGVGAQTTPGDGRTDGAAAPEGSA